MSEFKTRMIVLSPKSSHTPSELAVKVYSLGLPITIKETCYGLMIEGEAEQVNKAIEELRKSFTYEIFSKERGYPMGDHRVCRADRGGGSRPGFHQLEKEFDVLPFISEALEDIGSGVKVVKKRKEKRIEASEIGEIAINILKSKKQKREKSG